METIKELVGKTKGTAIQTQQAEQIVHRQNMLVVQTRKILASFRKVTTTGKITVSLCKIDITLSMVKRFLPRLEK